MRFPIPEPLVHEHQELHRVLAEATKLGGALGDAARAVAHELHDHFVREEEIAMPPLSLLPALAAGRVTAEMAGLFTMTDALQAELPRMLQEHERIKVALAGLRALALESDRPDLVRFADQLIVHARTEEEVLYPAAIVLAEYLRLRLVEVGS